MSVNFKKMIMQPGNQKLIIKDGLVYGIPCEGRAPMRLKDYVQIAYQDYLITGGIVNYQEHPTWVMLEQGKIAIKQEMTRVNIALNQAMLPDEVRHHGEGIYDQLNAKHRKLVTLQLEVENKINQHD